VTEVAATGPHTKFGRTAELVRTAHIVSSEQKAVLRAVRNLAVFLKMPLADIVHLKLTQFWHRSRLHLPATFTLASALGARALAKRSVLPTRLSAVDEAATMDVLCADKTGTLTRNALTVTSVRTQRPIRERQIP
jgi:H+-transporting ATPase